MSDYCAFLANCLVGGDEVSYKPDGRWVRDTIRWKLNGYRICLIQREEVAKGAIAEFRGKWVNTSRLIVENVPEEKVKQVEVIIKDVAALLSFAGGSPVRVFGYEYPMDSGKQAFVSTFGNSGFFRPTIDIFDGSAVRHFVAACWKGFRRQKNVRKLPEVFEYLAIAENSTIPMELKLLTLFIVLESLKDTYAKQRKIPFVKGWYRKTSTPPKTNPAREQVYRFEELLASMLNEQGIRRGLKRIISLRNDLIHSGLARKPFRSLWKTYCNAHDIVRLYLLHILGYSGSYFVFSERDGLKRM